VAIGRQATVLCVGDVARSAVESRSGAGTVSPFRFWRSTTADQLIRSIWLAPSVEALKAPVSTRKPQLGSPTLRAELFQRNLATSEI
jgi:hypothetical protein